MASTYSDLKIELIGTGEQVGTWGNTTNTNLGTALGEAITGSANVTFSSVDVTITLTDTNASQTARNLRLVCTGTSGGARNLILGSGCQIEKLYLIQNDLADAVTVKNTTGTGVTVPAGRSQFVFNDGTNVVEASSSVIDLTTDVTGTLPVANGGTGQTTYTNGQLLVGNTTGNTLTKATLTGTANRLTVTNGSGSITLNVDATNANTANKVVARDGSGNFSAGTITANLTGNVTGNATNVTGTVAVAKGGTGRTTLTNNSLLVGNATSAVSFIAAGTSGNVLTSNGTSWSSQPISAGGNYIMHTYTSPATWTKPAGLKAVKVTVVGGGGNGGGAPGPTTTSKKAGAGGGSGAVSIRFIAAPSIPGPVAVASGGASATSSFGAFASATGGSAGGAGPSTTSPATASGGAGGSASGGNLNLPGTSGSPAFIVSETDIAFNAGAGNAFSASGRAQRNDRTAGVAGSGLGAGGGGCGRTPRSPKTALPVLSGGAGTTGAVIVEEFY